MNEHKFYNEYIKPVIDEIKEELTKRGVDCRIVGRQLHKDGDLLVSYDLEICQFYVDKSIQHLFSNDFDYTFNTTTELIFAPIKPKSIYDLTIGDEFYYIEYFGFKARVAKCVINSEGAYKFYKQLAENDETFLTEVECERAMSKKQAVAKIKKRAHELQDDWRPDWDNHDEDKIYIRYGHSNKILRIFVIQQIKHTGICFKSREIAHQIIDELPEECKLMLEVYDD